MAIGAGLGAMACAVNVAPSRSAPAAPGASNSFMISSVDLPPALLWLRTSTGGVPAPPPLPPPPAAPPVAAAAGVMLTA
jgi:hypothetical protein